MLNRRTLRIKAMQAIFAFQTAKKAEYEIVKTEVGDVFLPDMNTMEEQDKDQLAADKKLAMETFDKVQSEIDLKNIKKEVSEEIVKAVEGGLNDLKNRVNKAKSSLKKRMVQDTNHIYNNYLELLMLPLEFVHISSQEKSKRGIENFNLKSNGIISNLAENKLFEKECLKHNVSWQKNFDELRSWYREIIKKDEIYEEYDLSDKPKFEDDKAILIHFYKNIIFKNDTISQFLEAEDINWSENKAILKSMVLKSIKSFESEEDELILMSLSKNWEEDLLFLKEIYDLSIDNEKEYENIISERSKNWDIDRVALTDKIILEMAVAEMMNFPSIPVKVTINEYIELSKLYSTPKSKEFVNGILDALSEELKKEGKIKKSGRGLLDNK